MLDSRICVIATALRRLHERRLPAIGASRYDNHHIGAVEWRVSGYAVSFIHCILSLGETTLVDQLRTRRIARPIGQRTNVRGGCAAASADHPRARRMPLPRLFAKRIAAGFAMPAIRGGIVDLA